MEMAEKMIGAREVADFLGVHYNLVIKMAARGELPMQKLGQSWRILPSQLREWWYSRQQKTGADLSDGGKRELPESKTA